MNSIIPSYFIIGIVLLTWTTYIIAYLARNTSEPLAVANSLALTFIAFLYAFMLGVSLKAEGKEST